MKLNCLLLTSGIWATIVILLFLISSCAPEEVSVESKKYDNLEDKKCDNFEGKRYDHIYGLIDVGGKLAYTAVEGEIERGKWFVVFDGIESKKYNYSTGFIDVGGKPAYIAGKENKQFVVLWCGKEADY